MDLTWLTEGPPYYRYVSIDTMCSMRVQVLSLLYLVYVRPDVDHTMRRIPYTMHRTLHVIFLSIS